jgi:phage shock protein B
MHGDLTAIVGILGGTAIVGMVIVAPIWIIAHYVSQSRREKALKNAPSEDQELIGRLLALMEKMEARISALEQILDADHPRWREHRAVNDRV